MNREKNKNKCYFFSKNFIVALTAFIMFDALFSLLFYFYKKENLIETNETYDYILYGTLAALFIFIVPVSRILLNYFIHKEFDD